ncbi:Uma2 family endonuclease [Actinoplanes solisilvae]|uniref:Uma2 family endonuclease n=1 Tax=Actinoplanes solisilvae TaxID=2486853 RepID=UPI001F0CA8C5|nr:Uma2 family endonuclease [Actinoplanes solisilvae]
MTEADLAHFGPWTEEEFLALDRTTNRIELVDGGLWVSPGPGMHHQGISYQLHAALRPAARAAGLLTFEGINVRLEPGTIYVPDLTVIDARTELDAYVEASDTVLIAEILSPSSRKMDRVTKRHAYAAAKIAWYLLVEPDLSTYAGVSLWLFRLDGDEYVEASAAKRGETLHSDEPFPIALRTNDLLAR